MNGLVYKKIVKHSRFPIAVSQSSKYLQTRVSLLWLASAHNNISADSRLQKGHSHFFFLNISLCTHYNLNDHIHVDADRQILQ